MRRQASSLGSRTFRQRFLAGWSACALGTCLLMLPAMLSGCASVAPLKTTTSHQAFYRSKQLSGEQLKKTLDEKKITTVINLRGFSPEAEWYQAEKKVCDDAQVTLLDVSFASESPDRAEVAKLIRAYRSSKGPILVHGRFAQGSAGFASGLYRLVVDSAAPVQAQSEMAGWHHHRLPGAPMGKYHEFLANWRGEADFWANYQAHQPIAPKQPASQLVLTLPGPNTSVSSITQVSAKPDLSGQTASRERKNPSLPLFDHPAIPDENQAVTTPTRPPMWWKPSSWKIDVAETWAILVGPPARPRPTSRESYKKAVRLVPDVIPQKDDGTPLSTTSDSKSDDKSGNDAKSSKAPNEPNKLSLRTPKIPLVSNWFGKRRQYMGRPGGNQVHPEVKPLVSNYDAVMVTGPDPAGSTLIGHWRLPNVSQKGATKPLLAKVTPRSATRRAVHFDLPTHRRTQAEPENLNPVGPVIPATPAQRTSPKPSAQELGNPSKPLRRFRQAPDILTDFSW